MVLAPPVPKIPVTFRDAGSELAVLFRVAESLDQIILQFVPIEQSKLFPREKALARI